MGDEIRVEQDGAILRVTLNRPATGNDVTDDMARQLGELLARAGDVSRLVVLRGAGADFCVGRAGGRPQPSTPPEALARRRQTEVIFDCYGAFRRASVPILGVVQGRALGFGCSIAALCDITLASEAATFQVPEMGPSHHADDGALLARRPPVAQGHRLSRLHVGGGVGAKGDDVRPRQRRGPGVGARRRRRERLRRHPADGAAGDARGEGISAQRHAYGRARRSGFARNLHATINSSSEMRRNG